MKTQTLKGFRDFLPADAIRRAELIRHVTEVFELYGFDRLETPALEYADVLLGKYGEEADRLLYLFEDNGKRRVGLRYDQTVPLSRVVAQYPDLPIPFKRYQIQPVWRAENTQKGRFREFMQCDIDTVGSADPLSDAEIIAATLSTMSRIGLPDPMMQINDRTIFDQLGLTPAEVIIIDKLDKIGREKVLRQLMDQGRNDADRLFTTLESSQPTTRLTSIFEALESYGFKRDVSFAFNPFLARGLDYYTSTIFELTLSGYSGGSLAGGGRYDRLIGTFSGRDLPAVGIAFGFDRILDALADLHLITDRTTATQVYVTVFSEQMLQQSLRTVQMLREAGISSEITLTSSDKLEKQLKYADKKGVPYAVIIGPDEADKNELTVKDLRNNSQERISIANLIHKVTSDQ